MAKFGESKQRYWVGVLYPENMKPDWQDTIGDDLQLPYAYCIHNADRDSKSEHRKDHVHIIIVFPNTTTYRNAMTVFSKLSAEGRSALNKCEPVTSIRHMYDYLIHDTETARKQKKELYDPGERITGNNFDIGAYEQIGVEEKKAMRRELERFLFAEEFKDYTEFYKAVIIHFDDEYPEIVVSYSAHFERLARGNYLKWLRRREAEERGENGQFGE